MLQRGCVTVEDPCPAVEGRSCLVGSTCEVADMRAKTVRCGALPTTPPGAFDGVSAIAQRRRAHCQCSGGRSHPRRIARNGSAHDAVPSRRPSSFMAVAACSSAFAYARAHSARSFAESSAEDAMRVTRVSSSATNVLTAAVSTGNPYAPSSAGTLGFCAFAHLAPADRNWSAPRCRSARSTSTMPTSSPVRTRVRVRGPSAIIPGLRGLRGVFHRRSGAGVAAVSASSGSRPPRAPHPGAGSTSPGPRCPPATCAPRRRR